MKLESDFEKELKRLAPLYGCLVIIIPDVIPKKYGGIMPVSHKRPCDCILVTLHQNYLIELKFGNNLLLPHQKATESKVNVINNSYYVLRKKAIKRGIFYSIEQNKEILLKTEEIEDIFGFFQGHYFSTSTLPTKKKKLRRVLL